MLSLSEPESGVSVSRLQFGACPGKSEGLARVQSVANALTQEPGQTPFDRNDGSTWQLDLVRGLRVLSKCRLLHLLPCRHRLENALHATQAARRSFNLPGLLFPIVSVTLLPAYT